MTHAPARSLVAATTLAAVLVASASALAGTLQVRDEADLLTPAQEAQLRASGARYDFDARVLTSARLTSRADFNRHVAAQVAGPNMVVVGIDPVHRWSSVHFGTGARIASARFAAIENAGDGYFRGARWEEGLGAILGAAQQSVGTARASVPAPESPQEGFPWRYVVLGLLAVGGIALAVRAFRSTSRAADGGWRGPTDGYHPDAYRAPAGGYGPPHGGYGPPHGGYGHAPGSGLGTGLAGAALGGLAGYAIGSAMAHHGEETHVGNAADTGNDAWDAGGSTSGWDDGGGGGGDFGGGGDAGGGGGDW